MSNTVTVKNFHDGIAADIYEASPSEFAIAKHFDILTYPTRLQPLRGMQIESTGQGIGNIQVFSDGLMYAMGTTVGSPTVGKLWRRSGYGNSDTWVTMVNWSASGNVTYPLLVEYPDASGAVNTIFYCSPGTIVSADPTGVAGSHGESLSFTNIGQGFVHPKVKTLYIPYDNKIATFTTSSTTINAAQFSLSSKYQIPCLTNYGDYLAIPSYTSYGVGVNGSVVYLWDRDKSNTLPNESINWGSGQLKVLNNLNGALIGISMTAPSAGGNSDQDSASIVIKEYSGGTEAVVIKELIAQHFGTGLGGTSPSVAINPNVNFIKNNRLYFSIDVDPNDGLNPARHGLWSVGKNKINGRYTVTLERMATNDGSETSVLAAAMQGDFVATTHTAYGTVTVSANGVPAAGTYLATSIYESTVNPSMGTNRYTRLHPLMQKQLLTFAVHTLPMIAGQQVTGKVRVDSQSSSAWVTAFFKTSTSPTGSNGEVELVAHEQVTDASGTAFTSGRNLEFRLESTGGAVITGFTYTYEILKTNLGEKL